MPVQFLLQGLDDEQSVVTGHLDLASDDADAEVRRHVVLGAREGYRGRGWVAMADPTGRTYCVTRRSPS